MKKINIILILIAFLLIVSIIPGSSLYAVNWLFLTTGIIILGLTAFFWRLEESKISTQEITLMATLAALAALARMPFAFLMSVQPTFFIVMITGYVFGSRSGFLVGAVAVLVSNFYAGQGPWTPWQMFSMGLSGASAALLAKKQQIFNLKAFAAYCGLWGFLYGWIMNIWHWTGFVYPLNLKTFIAAYTASFSFESARALGNVIFSLVLGNSFYNILVRFKKKLYVHSLY